MDAYPICPHYKNGKCKLGFIWRCWSNGLGCAFWRKDNGLLKSNPFFILTEGTGQVVVQLIFILTEGKCQLVSQLMGV